jgi:hypothetical protein
MGYDSIIVLGNSNSGKDTVFSLLSDRFDVANFKFSSPMKAALEMLYTLPKGALEDKAFRNTLVPHLGVTWNDLMIKCWEHWNQVDPWMGKQKVIKDAIWVEHLPVFTDIRHIMEFAKVRHSFNPLVIHLVRDEAEAKPSDVNVPIFLEQLDWYWTVKNNGSIEDLKNFLYNHLPNHIDIHVTDEEVSQDNNFRPRFVTYIKEVERTNTNELPRRKLNDD